MMMDLKTIAEKISICAVTKGRSLVEIEAVFKKYPFIKIIAENRWPDCVEKFQHFKNLEKHFIGPLQSNKIRKVIKITDVIQSVDSFELLTKIDRIASEEGKKIDFCFQINISNDLQKQGMEPSEVSHYIEQYLSADFKNANLVGLMTIGSQDTEEKRYEYFLKFKDLFETVNEKYFPTNKLALLSMGMSEDYQPAVRAGATMIRLGSALFAK